MRLFKNAKILLWAIAVLLSLGGCNSPLPALRESLPPELNFSTPVPTHPPQATITPSLTPSLTLAPIQEISPTYTPEATISPTPAAYGPDYFPDDVNPLTGLKVEAQTMLERRPMAIKVTNFPRSTRPQWGLSKADHIFEYYLEDGLTRFIAIFYGQEAARVGPIRSARVFDAHIVQMYKAIFAFGYADDRVMDLFLDADFKNRLVIQRPDNCPPMCRIGPKNAYNTLYTNTAELTAYINARGTENSRQELKGLRFEEYPFFALSGGGKAEEISIRYSRTSYHKWVYYPSLGKYYRDQEAQSGDFGEEVFEPMFDQLSGEQLSADNLILLLVPTGYFYQSNSTEMYDIQMKGEGAAYAFRNGKVFRVKWSRPTPDGLVSILFPNNTHFPLKPGNVWFEVLGASSTREVLNNTNWWFFFDIP